MYQKISLKSNQVEILFRTMINMNLNNNQVKKLLNIFDNDSINYISEKDKCFNIKFKDGNIVSKRIGEKIDDNDKIDSISEESEYFMSKDRLGNITWMFLHGILQNVDCTDDILTDQQLKYILILLDIINNFFPCGECRSHFSETRKKYPFPSNTKSKKKICNYVCSLHNKVNEDLKKSIFNEKDLEFSYTIPLP